MNNHYRPAPVLAIDPDDPLRVVDKSGSTFAVCASKTDAADIVRGAAVINAAIGVMGSLGNWEDADAEIQAFGGMLLWHNLIALMSALSKS